MLKLPGNDNGAVRKAPNETREAQVAAKVLRASEVSVDSWKGASAQSHPQPYRSCPGACRLWG